MLMLFILIEVKFVIINEHQVMFGPPIGAMVLLPQNHLDYIKRCSGM